MIVKINVLNLQTKMSYSATLPIAEAVEWSSDMLNKNGWGGPQHCSFEISLLYKGLSFFKKTKLLFSERYLISNHAQLYPILKSLEREWKE